MSTRAWRAIARRAGAIAGVLVLGATLGAGPGAAWAGPLAAAAGDPPVTRTATPAEAREGAVGAALRPADGVPDARPDGVPDALFDAVDPKTSLAVLSDEAAWASTGFRVGLGYTLEGLLAEAPVPAGVVHAAQVRLGARLDADWSLLGTFRYGVLPGATPMLRFSGTVEPTLHVGDGLSLGVGLGLGGLVHPSTGARTPEPTDPLIASLTLTDTTRLLGACSGTGAIATLRAEYTFQVGELFATGPAVTADVQWTACVETLTRVDPDTGAAIVLRQYWRHTSVGVGWMVWWR